MPKDPTRNQPNFKIGGDHLNEYEYDLNKGQITKDEQDHFPRSKNETADQENLAAESESNTADGKSGK
jgi:hypothetical protein